MSVSQETRSVTSEAKFPLLREANTFIPSPACPASCFGHLLIEGVDRNALEPFLGFGEILVAPSGALLKLATHELRLFEHVMFPGI